MVINFENIINIEMWPVEELEKAVEYYEGKLLQYNDDNDQNWYVDTITKCKRLIEKATNKQSDWESLFQ